MTEFPPRPIQKRWHCIDASIIVATLNRPDHLIPTLHMALAQQSEGYAYEIIVVDQTADYPPEVAKQLEELKDRVVYIQSSVRSASHARNIGIKAAKGSIVIFIDDDVSFASTLVADHIALHERYPLAGAILGLIIENSWTDHETCIAERISWYVPRGLKDEFGGIPITWAPSGNISYKMEPLTEVGGFDESMTSYAEDIDLSLRVRSKGHPIIFSLYPKLLHLGASRGGCEQRNEAIQNAKARERHLSMFYMLFKNWSVLGLFPVISHLFGSIRSEFLNFATLQKGLGVFVQKASGHSRLILKAFLNARQGRLSPCKID